MFPLFSSLLVPRYQMWPSAASGGHSALHSPESDACVLTSLQALSCALEQRTRSRPRTPCSWHIPDCKAREGKLLGCGHCAREGMLRGNLGFICLLKPVWLDQMKTQELNKLPHGCGELWLGSDLEHCVGSWQLIASLGASLRGTDGSAVVSAAVTAALNTQLGQRLLPES